MNRLMPLVIFTITCWAIWVNLPQLSDLPWVKSLTNRYPVKLGLDLQGGTELILQAQMDRLPSGDKDAALESVIKVIERRVNLYGVSEAVVRSSKIGSERRILVELPGVKDTGEAVNLVGSTAQLQFREVLVSTHSALLSLENTRSTNLTGADLKKAKVTYGQSGTSSGPQVSIEFTLEGAKKFAQITRVNVGKPLAIFLDNIPISAPVVEQEIIGGSAVVSGQFTLDAAKNLSIQLNAGALPVPITIIHQRSIGPSLGEVSIQKGIIAGSIGVSTVMIYLVAYYGLLGLVASFTLIIYSLLVLAIFRTGVFILPPITLTLAGMAGFVLSVGMAVDANILTFERIKEELRGSKSKRAALESGFLRAWPSIKDSNTSSLITATILYILGTAVVRGFAVTLFIGVLVSMFSAMVVTRTFLRLLPMFKN